jgi:hypothetical protein
MSELKDNNSNPLNDIPMLSNSFLTEEGFVNPACINELESFIKNIPPVHERSTDDIEWTTKEWIFKKEITSTLAKWAIRQSPYSYPDNLETVIRYLDACLDKSIEWKIKTDAFDAMTELSLNEISKLLYDILWDFKEFKEWNCSKKGDVQIQYTSVYDFGNIKDPDYDFIDISELINNVSIEIRDIRRKDKEFDKKFKEEYGKK